MIRRLLPLVFVLALVSMACAEATDPELEFGSGRRFVPLVADPLNDAGSFPSVAVDADGAPFVAYLAFEEETEEDELPAARPVGAPTLPGVLLTTVNEEGIWSRGAIALEAQIPNVTVPFSPAAEESVGKLSPTNRAGLRLVSDDERFHAAWGSSAGLYYATGSLDPAATEQVRTQLVTSSPPRGLSIAVDGSGTPWIAFYSSTSAAASVDVATPDGEDWTVESVVDAAGCDACATAVLDTDAGAAVAYSNGGDGVAIATNDGENAWQSFDVADTGGAGLSATTTADGVTLLYYDGASVVEASGSPAGPFRTTAVAEVGVGAAEAEADGARTSVAATEDGVVFAAWQDAEGIRFAEAGQAGFNAIETAPDTDGGQMPAVSVAPDGSRAYLAWYDPDEQDLLVGLYGEIDGLALAERSPQPSGAPQAPAPPTDPEACEDAVDGNVSIQAAAIAFDTPCVNVPAAEAFSIEFGNQDAGVQHNVSIYPSEEELTDPIFEGLIITGPDSITYKVDPLDSGSYYFHCDVHPNMNGTINAGEGDAGGGDGATGATGGITGSTGSTGTTGTTGSTGGGDATGTVVAVNIAFDVAQIDLPADTETSLTFDNQDAGVPHNIAIFPTEEDLTEPLFRGETITGPDQIEYAIPALEAGEYYFHCDVHPNMNGAVAVA